MADEICTPSILRHLFKNDGLGPELNDDLVNGGHADDASTLTNGQKITFSGDTSGEVEFDGSEEVNCELTTTYWDGAAKTLSTGSPSSSNGADGDIWFQYIS